MQRAILFAIIFTLVGAFAFSLSAPILFAGSNFSQLGQKALPLIVVVFGGTGFFVGLRSTKKEKH